MPKFLLEFDEYAAFRFSAFLVAGLEDKSDDNYAGMTEVTVCDACSAVVTDIENHFEGAHSA